MILVPKVQFCVLLNLYFKTTCSIRPMGGLKVEGPLFICKYITFNQVQETYFLNLKRKHMKSVSPFVTQLSCLCATQCTWT